MVEGRTVDGCAVHSCILEVMLYAADLGKPMRIRDCMYLCDAIGNRHFRGMPAGWSESVGWGWG